MIRGNSFSVDTMFFSVSSVFIPEWTWKSKLSEPGVSFSAECSEKDKYTDLCEKELV